MTTVYFVSSVPSLQALNKWKNSVSDAVFVACDANTTSVLQKENIPHKTARDYSLPDSNKRAVDFLNNWSTTRFGEQTIKDAMIHDGFSFWWCMKQWLFYSFMYRNSLSSIIVAIDFVRGVIDAEKPSKIVYCKDNTVFSTVIPVICHSFVANHSSFADHSYVATRMALSAVPVSVSKKSEFTAFVKPFAIQQFLRIHTLARRMVWAVINRKNHKKPNIILGGILAVCSYHWRTVDHPVFKTPVRGDTYISPVLEYLKEVPTTYVDATQREYVGFKALKEKAVMPEHHVLLEQFLKLTDFFKAMNIVRTIKNRVRSVVRNPVFKDAWMFDGINIWQLIAPQFWCYFTYRLEGHVMDFLSVQRMINALQPQVVVYPCEAGDLAYVFFHHAKQHGIPAVSIQHGTMMYSSLTVQAKEDMLNSKTSVPRPSTILVYGEYYKNLLVQGNYPGQEIRVIGNLRYDHFASVRQTKEVLCKKYGLDASKKVIMYLTQILPDVAETTAITRAVFKAVAQLKLPLIVKQHPGEMSDAIYHQIAKEYGITPFITKTGSTLELLQVSDVLIGCESTLDYEAMILGVPVIITHFNQPVSLPFIKEGAAVSATSPEQVAAVLQKTLSDLKFNKKLSVAAHKLVTAHCYKVDGKVAERASIVIMKLLEKKT